MSQAADRVPTDTATSEAGSERRGHGLSIVPSLPASPVLAVAVVSRHQLTHAGLAELLSTANVATVELPSATDAPDVVIYELTSDAGGVPDDLGALLSVGVPVVALTSPWDAHLEELVLAMGVADIVRADTDAAGLVQVLQRVASGRTTTLVDHRAHRRELARAGADLTGREMSILELVGAGLPNRDVADRLYLSVNTVKSHIRSAYRKIGVTRRTEAVMWAVRHDLTPG